jgi:hypothetical protein
MKKRSINLNHRDNSSNNIQVRMMKIKQEKLRRNSQLSLLGLVLTATSTMLRTTCLGTSASVEGTMSLHSLLLFYPIPVGSIAIRRETSIALMEGAMFSVIQVVALLAL